MPQCVLAIQLICEISSDRVPSFVDDKSWKYYSAKAVSEIVERARGFLKRDFISFIDANVIDRSAKYSEA